MRISSCPKALWPLALCSSLIIVASAHAQQGGPTEPDSDNALDRGYRELQRTPQVAIPSGNQAANARVTQLITNNVQQGVSRGDSESNEAFDLAQIRADVQREQTMLEQLNRNTLEIRAQRGERAAQVALGVDFARESTLLSFAPAAANDALSDAIRWYSLAAMRGYPGAPSLDQAGIRFYPVRASRASSN